MMNYYEIMQLLAKNDCMDTDVIQAIRDDFNADFRNEYAKVHFNNTTRKQAVNSFIGNNTKIYGDSNYSGIFATQTSIILPNNGFSFDSCKDSDMDLYSICKEWIKGSNHIPVDFHFKESIAIARALGWTQGKRPDKSHIYHVAFKTKTGEETKEHFFDFNLVYSIGMLIADKDINYGGIDCFLVKMQDSEKCLLGLRSKNGMAFILPNVVSQPALYTVDFNFYMAFENKIDEMIISGSRKTA